MNKKIIFGDKELLVTEVYAYKYSNGKIVLRVFANEENVTEADMKLLKDNTSVIDYYEQEETLNEETGKVVYGDWIKKLSYENYASGEYTSSYQNGVYSAEITKLGEIEIEVKQNTANIDYIAIMTNIDL